jgi:hypothetical protein
MRQFIAVTQDTALLLAHRKVTWGEYAQKSKGLRANFKAQLAQVRL